MMNSHYTPHGLLLSWTILIGLLLIGVSTFFIAGPVLETKWLPVFEDVTSTETTPALPGSVSFLVTGNKVRPCEYIETVARIYYDDKNKPGSGHWEAAEVTTEVRSHFSRPLGMQSMGTWTVTRFDGKPIEDGHPINVEIHSRCHPLWTTVNNFGVWKQ